TSSKRPCPSAIYDRAADEPLVAPSEKKPLLVFTKLQRAGAPPLVFAPQIRAARRVRIVERDRTQLVQHFVDGGGVRRGPLRHQRAQRVTNANHLERLPVPHRDLLKLVLVPLEDQYRARSRRASFWRFRDRGRDRGRGRGRQKSSCTVISGRANTR